MKKEIEDILTYTEHRPWKIPNQKWFWYQEWNGVIFLHYQIEEKILRGLVPSSLELDSFDGSYWISVVAFSMNEIHTRHTFPIQYLSNFYEVNLRTYVKSNNKPGVYFLSIEAEKLIPTLLANLLSGLPYKHSQIKRSSNSYSLLGKRAKIEIEFKIAKYKSNPSKFDLWLTERYCLYQGKSDDPIPLEVHHKPWELYGIDIGGLEIQYNQLDHIVDFQHPALCHYSPGVKVIAWNL
ncbi:hypothetical protein LEP1GSC195_3707 [Leptospira wolbachii serovar Codice str. CDC]|uniref:DUF2071 domain-containing protein n=1 Tax=Leptospira wolbachii serovar Codice str. CDC TaxID=1218599 RepID=R9A9I4_9LEPT|nr:DUF2071 domain-containing protein [Leptospira wolbachii]EOQ96880.1 hypothetical protein LEP1GSC195_3707 [Leptospira wolbachii serovar Codice str. CDC]